MMNDCCPTADGWWNPFCELVKVPRRAFWLEVHQAGRLTPAECLEILNDVEGAVELENACMEGEGI